MQEWFALPALGGLVLWGWYWWAWAKTAKERGTGWFFRHLCGAFLGFTAYFFLVMASGGLMLSEDQASGSDWFLVGLFSILLAVLVGILLARLVASPGSEEPVFTAAEQDEVECQLPAFAVSNNTEEPATDSVEKAAEPQCEKPAPEEQPTTERAAPWPLNVLSLEPVQVNAPADGSPEEDAPADPENTEPSELPGSGTPESDLLDDADPELEYLDSLDDLDLNPDELDLLDEASHSQGDDDFTPQEVAFLYEDAEGNISKRQVWVEKTDGVRFEGFCRDRHARRTFRVDRVLGLIELKEAGRAVDPEEFFRASRLTDKPVHSRTVPEPAIEVLFSGFDKLDRELLEDDAREAGMIVRKTVTKNLFLLVAGPRCGPRKKSEAISQGVLIIDEEEFDTLIATGELPLDA